MFSFLTRNAIQSIDISELNGLIGKIELIDIREPYEYQSGMIKTAKNIPMDQLLKEPEKYLMNDKKYYIVCQAGGRSSRAVSNLNKQGFDVVDIRGGTDAYLAKYGR